MILFTGCDRCNGNTYDLDATEDQLNWFFPVKKPQIQVFRNVLTGEKDTIYVFYSQEVLNKATDCKNEVNRWLTYSRFIDTSGNLGIESYINQYIEIGGRGLPSLYFGRDNSASVTASYKRIDNKMQWANYNPYSESVYDSISHIAMYTADMQATIVGGKEYKDVIIMNNISYASSGYELIAAKGIGIISFKFSDKTTGIKIHKELISY